VAGHHCHRTGDYPRIDVPLHRLVNSLQAFGRHTRFLGFSGGHLAGGQRQRQHSAE
jgi:hypothetical protein